MEEMEEDKRELIGVLRRIDESEVELMREWRNAPGVRANMYTQHEISSDEHLAWWQAVKDREDCRYLMYVLADKPLGIVSMTKIDKQNRNASWAFYASPQAAKGTGTRMEFLALDFAFLNLDLHKLYCEVLAYNEPVVKLHKKFGFKVEGTFVHQYRRADDFVDVYRLALFGESWRASRSEMLERITSLARRGK